MAKPRTLFTFNSHDYYRVFAIIVSAYKAEKFNKYVESSIQEIFRIKNFFQNINEYLFIIGKRPRSSKLFDMVRCDLRISFNRYSHGGRGLLPRPSQPKEA